MKHNAIIYLMVLLLAACSSRDEDALSSNFPLESDNAIGFTTNLDEDIWEVQNTRATTGAISDLKAVPEGFGVIAYLTDEQTWSEAKDAWVSSGITNKEYGTGSNFPRPDFMYDQPVTWYETEGRWGYSPMKYWPNYTDNDNTTHGPRRISFFAYAPFVDGSVINAASGTGVTGMTWAEDLRPHVIYTVDEDGTNPVDLLWAKKTDATRNGEGLIYFESTTEKWQAVPLEFKHALSCVDVYVQRVYDEPTYSGKTAGKETDTTKIFMQELKFTSTNTASNGLFKKGRLNLEDGKWSSFADSNNSYAQVWQAGTGSLTFPATAFVDSIAGTLSEVEADIRNLELEKWGDKTTGVDQDSVKLFKAGSIMLIPQDDELTITPSIKYSMVTRGDPGDLVYSPLVDAAGNHYSRILNDVTGNELKLKLVAGKRYKLVIRIGVEHVTFQVQSVVDWDFPIRLTPEPSDLKEEKISHKLNED